LSLEERTAKGDEHKTKGNTLLGEQKYTEAIQEYDAAIHYSPTNAIYFANRGLAYQKLNNHKSAIDDFQQALKHNPSYVKAYPRLGKSYITMRDLTAAAKIIDEGLVLDPTDTSLLSLKQELEQLRDLSSGGAGGMDGFPIPGMPGFGGMPNMPPGMGGFPGMGGGAGMPGIMELMNNPDFMNMAAQVVQNNPEIMNMARQVAQNPQMLSQLFNQSQFGPAGTGTPPGGASPGSSAGGWPSDE